MRVAFHSEAEPIERLRTSFYAFGITSCLSFFRPHILNGESFHINTLILFDFCHDQSMESDVIYVDTYIRVSKFRYRSRKRDPLKERYKSRWRISPGVKIYGKTQSQGSRTVSSLVVRHTLTFLTYILPSCCSPVSCPSDVQALSRVPQQRFPRKKLERSVRVRKIYIAFRASLRSSRLTFLLEITKNVPKQLPRC